MGVVNTNGNVALRGCSCGSNSKAVLIQESAQRPSSKLFLTVKNSTCTKIEDYTKEFDIFGSEYEVRYFNKGLYTYDRDTITRHLPLVLLLLVISIFMMPLLHATVWNFIFAAFVKKKKSN